VAIVGDAPGETPEVSTQELLALLTDSTVILLDARPPLEYAISHLPDARNVAPKPGVPASLYVSDVAAVDRLVSGNHQARLVLYCNGPFCGKSKRLAAELRAAGYTEVRRYQLGIPVWRALGGICETEVDGLRHIVAHDQTAVLIDARDPTAYRAGTLPGARNIPRSLVVMVKDSGEVRRAKDDGRLPMEDHNTRLIVIGAAPSDARYVAEALTREAFHNVSYFPGTFESAAAALPAAPPN
jgi:rhodanese-related sulfurtransferase